MRYLAVVVLLALSVACGAPETVENLKQEAGRASGAVQEEPASVAPHIVKKPDFQPGGILSEKINWSREDRSVTVRVTINPTGTVIASRLVAVSPADDDLAVELGPLVAEGFNAAVFEAPDDFSYPYSFDVTVNFPAWRDASGRLK